MEGTGRKFSRRPREEFSRATARRMKGVLLLFPSLPMGEEQVRYSAFRKDLLW